MFGRVALGLMVGAIVAWGCLVMFFPPTNIKEVLPSTSSRAEAGITVGL